MKSKLLFIALITSQSAIIFLLPLMGGMRGAAQNYQWANSIGGTGTDAGIGITQDGTGNVYITGYFEGTTDFDPGPGTANLTTIGGKDIFISKYSSTGNFLWAKSIGSASNDYGINITFDGSGNNVCVTGNFYGTADFDPGPGTAYLTPAGGFDIFLAKYDNNGDYLWAINAGGTGNDVGNSIAVDYSGNVCITGNFEGTADFDPSASTAELTSAGGFDIFIAKYDYYGNYLWAKSIGSPANDGGISIAVDGSNNVYIAGSFSDTADFDPGAGTAYLTPVGGIDIFFAKYTGTGDYLWAKSIGSLNPDNGYSITVDFSGTVYITGSFHDTADFDPGPGTADLTATGNFDIFFAKYSSTGNFMWAKSIGSTSTDDGLGIALDGSGNVFIAGRFSLTADFDAGADVAVLTALGNFDVFFTKYDDNGNYLWAKNIGSAGNDLCYNIAADDSGNVSITGYFEGMADFDPGPGSANLNNNGGRNIFIAEYGPNAAGIEYLIMTADILIYPNPIKDEFIIRFENNLPSSSPLSLEFFNNFGQLVWQQHIKTSEHRIVVSNFPKGIYILKAVTGNETFYRKVVVE